MTDNKRFRVLRDATILVVVLLIVTVAWVMADTPPNTISYQGYLTDASENAIDGSRDMRVAFYTVSTGGSSVYTEDHSSVTVSDGQFNLQLGTGSVVSGALSSVDFSQALWIEITIDPSGTPETLSPRIPLSSVPYARYAFEVQQIGTLTADRWCTSDGSVINCTQNAPTDEVGAVTSGQWCRGDGSAVQCTSISDGALLDMSAVNSSSTTEGLKLPQAADVSAATAEGQISWDSDDDKLYVGNGTTAQEIGGGGGGGGYTTYTSSGSGKVTATCSSGTAVMGGCTADSPKYCGVSQIYPSIAGTALSGSQTPTAWTCYFGDQYLAQDCAGVASVTCQ